MIFIHKQLGRLAGFAMATLVILALSVPLINGVVYAATPAPTWVNEVVTPYSSATAATATVTAAAGDLLVAFGVTSNTSNTVSFTDTQNLTWASTATFTNTSKAQISWAVASASGSEVVTLHVGTASNGVLHVEQFRGLGSSVAQDGYNGSSGTSSGNITTTDTNEVYVAFALNSTTAIPTISGYTNDNWASFTTGNAAIAHGINATAGTYSAASSASGGTLYTALVAFKQVSAPGGFTLSAGTTGVTSQVLGWTASSGALTYDVYRNGSVVVSGLTATTYTDTGLTGSTSYSYKVRANASGAYTDSNTLSVTTLVDTGLTNADVNKFAFVLAAALGAWTIKQFRWTKHD